jgi:hypothetical protein
MYVLIGDDIRGGVWVACMIMKDDYRLIHNGLLRERV